MEVHAHSHSPRKKWTHYFWEFLMLFLAVFCGFLAEYQLEHKIEKERGKQYIRSFYEDLVNDSAHLNNLIARFQKKADIMNSIASCYDSLQNGLPQESCLKNIIANSFDFPDLVYTDRTLQQLKNAGGLRLLKEADADSILVYDNLLRKYKAAETSVTQENQSEIRHTLYSLINFENWKNSDPNSWTFALYGNNKETLNFYFNQLRLYSMLCQSRLGDLKIIKKENEALIAYFKKKYRME